ncbi:TIGR00266 family protein [Hahella sp. KA22]|uniref:TIGR00266 family protein n=1 Tax=Hahella sp. KA22 TaxID=1628392 RepID=UPI000FDE957D|nr:TIGR00266 family protein [Hahella sp. KA22]AZZ93847.1 TIGR00266 family protein [Hahella sp. KA22]QAY57220.1 TIGR00266 family protein [Hahella sp. KA22]
MRSHEVDYKIIGHDMQMVEVELDPGETVIAEAGAMNYMTGGIEFETKMGDGSDPEQGFFSKLFSAGKRMMTGESLFMTHFTNSGHGKEQVSFAAPYPGSIVPVDLANQGGTIICQKDSFLAAAMGTRISVEFNRRLGSGFFGGEGFVLQKLEGDGMAFIHACGTVVEKRLNNETLRLDTGCLVAFTPSISYEIEMVKGIRSMFFGGEGMFLATLRGTGTVWIQSLPFSRLADRILAHAPKQNGGVEVGED